MAANWEKGLSFLAERCLFSRSKGYPFLGPTAWSLPTMQRYSFLEWSLLTLVLSCAFRGTFSWFSEVVDDELHLAGRVVVSPRREVQFPQFPAQFAVVVDPEVQVVQSSLRRLDVWEVEHGQLRLPVGTDFEFFYHWLIF